VRSIREEVNFLPTVAKYRVYIIDEVHMLSTGAFNALLKTLEEPPEHVKFILATTEPQKLPATILSRCQRFDFKKISNEDIIKRLKIVCGESNINITEEALKIIAVLSEGAMRDALSILERCIQDGENDIDEDKIKELVGIPKLEYISKIVDAIINYDVAKAMETMNQVIDDGKDLNNFLWEIIKYVKDILVIKTNGKLDLYNEEELKNITEIAKKTEQKKAIDLIYELSEIENNMKLSTQKQIVFQAGIIRLCSKVLENKKENSTVSNSAFCVVPNQIDTSNLERRIANIENYLKSGTVNKIQSSKNTGSNKQGAINNTIKYNVSSVPKGKLQEYWPNVLNDLKNNGKILLYTNLLNTKAYEINDMTIGIEFEKGMNSFGKSVLEKPESINDLSKMISLACGKEMNVKYIDNSMPEILQTQEEYLQGFANNNEIPFDITE
jgi:DNA polymerase-3 subunit gamma/tau